MSLGHGASIVRDGLVLHLDAANTKSYSGSGTTWSDLSGSGNNGTLVNGVGYSSDNNGNMVFDGIDDYVDLNFSNTSYFTLFFSLNYDSNNIPSDNNHYPIICNASGGSQVDILEFQKFNIRFNRSGTGRVFDTQFYQTDSTTGAQGIGIPGPSFENNQYDQKWSSHCITLGNNDFVYYINGSKYGNNNTFDSSKLQTFNKFRVARTATGGWGVSQINISCISIYNRALTAAEVRQNFESTRSRYGI